MEDKRGRFFYLITLLHFLSLVKCSGYNFQRIDKNDDDSMPAGFTRVFHECSFDSGCKFVVKKKKGSELEILENIDGIDNFYNVWKKLELSQTIVEATNIALNKTRTMSSLYGPSTVSSNAVDGDLDSNFEKCALTKKDFKSPWLLVDLLSEYDILYVRIQNRDFSTYMRSEPFDVRVGNSSKSGGATNGFCVQQGSIPTRNTMMRFDCPQGTRGRYISFHTPPNQSYLDLCELEAYGFKV